VIVRSTGKRDWEDMPIYARVGMHLLFHGPAQVPSSHTWIKCEFDLFYRYASFNGPWFGSCLRLSPYDVGENRG